MNDALAVEEAEGDEDLADDEGGVLLLDRAALHLRARGRVQVQLQGRRQVEGEGGAWTHEGADAAAAGKVHGDPELVAVEVRAVVEGDVVAGGIAELGEEGDLALDLGDVVVGRVEVDDLEGDDGARVVVDALIDAAVRALADELLPGKELGDVLVALCPVGCEDSRADGGH